MEESEGQVMSDKNLGESEEARRDAAQGMRGQVIPGSGRPLRERKLDQMLSLRLDPDIVTELRSVARDYGVSISDLLREAVSNVIRDYRHRAFAVVIDRIDTGFRSTLPGRSIRPPSNPTQSGLRQEPVDAGYSPPAR